MQAEALHRQFKAKKDVMEKQSKSSIMDRYGNAARQPDSDEARLLLGQTEGYVEYNVAGRVIKGEEVKVQSILKMLAHPSSCLNYTLVDCQVHWQCMHFVVSCQSPTPHQR